MNLLTIKEAARKTDKSKKKLYEAVGRGQLHRYGTKNILVSEEELHEWVKKKDNPSFIRSPYGNIALNFNESLKLIDGVHNPNNMLRLGKYITDEKYAISNLGRAFNLTRNTELATSLSAHGYPQVDIAGTSERVHVIVATFWCPNAKLKTQVHHINGNKLDLRDINQIWCFPDEHDYAHKLLVEAKKTKNFEKYGKFISEIQKDNEWNNEYRGLTFDKDLATIFTWVPANQFSEYLNGFISLDDIDTADTMGGMVLRK